MAIKKRTTTYTMAAATGSCTLGLGAAYGKVLKVEWKGDDADVDTNATIGIVDADGRQILAATAMDAGTDDSSARHTGQTYSTVGIGLYLSPNEADGIGADGSAVATAEGLSSAPIAQSPVTIAFTAGTSGDVYQVSLFVEV